jgi:hypothetical protein
MGRENIKLGMLNRIRRWGVRKESGRVGKGKLDRTYETGKLATDSVWMVTRRNN